MEELLPIAEGLLFLVGDEGITEELMAKSLEISEDIAQQLLDTLQKKLFMGVFLSGRMYYENVIHLLPGAVALAEKRGMDLEILGHPGGVFEPDDMAQITSAEDLAFLTDDLRNRERSMFLIDL